MYVFYFFFLSASMSSMKWKSFAGRRRSPSEALAVQSRSLLFTMRSFHVSKPYITQMIMSAQLISVLAYTVQYINNSLTAASRDLKISVFLMKLLTWFI